MIFKKTVAILMTIILIAGLVGCGKKRKDPIRLTLSTEDSEAILHAAGITLPDIEDAKGANSTIKYFGWKDPYQNYSEAEIINTGYWTFENKYNGHIEWVETEYFERHNDLANLLLAGTAPDFCSGGVSNTAVYPMNCIKGMLQPVDPYVDFSNPLWNGVRGFADYFMLKGQHYQIVMFTKPMDLCVYNRRVIEEWGFDEPAELYYNDEWTWDVFYDMCLDFSDGEENRYALDGYGYQGGIMGSTGQMMFGVDSDGKFFVDMDNPAIERAQSLLYDLVKNDCCYHEGTNRWALRNGGIYGSGMKEGKCLFYILSENYFTGPVDEISAIWGDIANGEIMFAPMPRDPSGDGQYYTNSDFADTQGSICIINGAENPDGAALLASCIRFKILDPTVIQIDKKQLKEKYLWNDDMLDMSDECQRVALANPLIGLGGNLPDNLQSALDQACWDVVRSWEPATWAMQKEKYSEIIDYYVEELNSMMEEYKAE